MAFTSLMYHSLSDGRHCDRLYPKYTTRLATFREHLRALQDEGFHLCSFRDLLDANESGCPLPEKTCALTFDDGHRSSLDFADAMREARVTGTFFLTADYCRGRDEFLKAGEVCELAAAGFDFGAHGVTHRPLKFLPPDECSRELAESRAWLGEILGAPVRSMSLPAGQGGGDVIARAFQAGYLLVGNSREAANRTLGVPGEINRFVVLAGHTARDVVRIASASPVYVFRRHLRAAAIWLPKRLLRPYQKTRSDDSL